MNMTHFLEYKLTIKLYMKARITKSEIKGITYYQPQIQIDLFLFKLWIDISTFSDGSIFYFWGIRYLDEEEAKNQINKYSMLKNKQIIIENEI